MTRLLLFSCSVVSDSLRPHKLQHGRLLCPSLSPWVCSNSCPLSQWCHPTISSSAAPFSSCPQSFPDQDLFQRVSSSHLMTGLAVTNWNDQGTIQEWWEIKNQIVCVQGSKEITVRCLDVGKTYGYAARTEVWPKGEKKSHKVDSHLRMRKIMLSKMSVFHFCGPGRLGSQ